MRFTAARLLELLAGRMDGKEILADYLYLEKDDIKAVLQYSAHKANAKTLLKAS